jgi:ABC-type nitrate/sulfonate/bicarbonate transport system substrate-binding protein
MSDRRTGSTPQTQTRPGNRSKALIGSELKHINGIFAPTGSDIEEPQDLEGATLGVPFINSGTAKMMGAMLQDTYGIDIREDVESESAPPSVLYELMEETGFIDAAPSRDIGVTHSELADMADSA